MKQSKTEKQYIRIIRKMSGEQRLKAASLLNAWAKELITSSILEKKPNLKKKELEKSINQRFYSYEKR